jgi:hypothetical protein
MPDLPEARIVHATPTRVRLKVPSRRHDAAFFQMVEQRLRGWQNVEEVEVNPVTASILVHFSDPAALLREAISGNDLFRLVAPPDADGPDPPLMARIEDAVATTDGTLRSWTGGALDLRTVLFAALFAGGLQQLVRGNIAAPAATLLWYAATVVGLPGAPQPSRGEPEAA